MSRRLLVTVFLATVISSLATCAPPAPVTEHRTGYAPANDGGGGGGGGGY
jgi:hypothetical protein